MENLKELAKKNAEKGMRKAVLDFMEEWEVETQGSERIRSTTVAYRNDDYTSRNYYLISGEKELKCVEDGVFIDVHDSVHFSNHLSISDLRLFFWRLPSMISEIQEEMQARNDQNDEVIAKLNKMTEILKGE